MFSLPACLRSVLLLLTFSKFCQICAHVYLEGGRGRRRVALSYAYTLSNGKLLINQAINKLYSQCRVYCVFCVSYLFFLLCKFETKNSAQEQKCNKVCLLTSGAASLAYFSATLARRMVAQVAAIASANDNKRISTHIPHTETRRKSKHKSNNNRINSFVFKN